MTSSTQNQFFYEILVSTKPNLVFPWFLAKELDMGIFAPLPCKTRWTNNSST